MSFNFSAVYPSGVQASNTQSKQLYVTAVKLTFADFTTGGTASVKSALPADASIVGIDLWTKTTFSGNGVTVASLQLGVPGTVAKFMAATSLSLTAGAAVYPTALTNMLTEYDPTTPTGDQQLLFTGTATTGNPTAGEAYALIKYVR